MAKVVDPKKIVGETPDVGGVLDPAAKRTAAESAKKMEVPRLGLRPDTVIVDRAKFEELMVSLLHGYGDRYTAHALPSHVMVMFGLKSRQEAVDLLKEIQQSNSARKANAG